MELHNMTSLPDLHDGFLYGLMVSPEKTLILWTRLINGNNCTIKIPKLFRLRAENFLDGNIIFELNIYQGSKCPLELVKKIQNYNDAAASAFLEMIFPRIERNELNLLELSSSYGCKLLALFEESPQAIRYSLETEANGGGDAIHF